ncbi:Candidapepsin-8 [Lachnellula suecica]|uniref:Candidapepsin-8 n=1 Tax=Lachnellula suecica TaxID=602035 RepID=A0A8T9CEJ8_9HELO|nr:Candidapepsin-8 [Lachnellula suecica]
MRHIWTTAKRTAPDVAPTGLCLWIWTCFIASAAATTVPAAYGVPSSEVWQGNDGPWSTFQIYLGTPAQNAQVLISTAVTSTWVVVVEGCEGVGIPSNCSTTRGVFNVSESTSWEPNNLNSSPFYYLHVESNLGTNYAADQGEFGWETVGLGFQNSGGPVLNHTVVAGIETFDYDLGMFGLNPRPTNFTAGTDPQPSYLSLLYENGKIPSLSYSYTAGAAYRFNKVVGSLTLGGYDDSLYIPNTITFPFGVDTERDLLVGLTSITGSGGQTLLPNSILALIDSTVSPMWLPVEACEAFESTFGLVYDTASSLYLVNDTQHTALLKQNTSLTFTLSTTLQGTDTFNITFPYAAFDLQAQYPLVNGTQRYFPLQRAANDTQYTLGRTFLQEAYLTVDYGRSNFSVSQRKWELSPQSHVVDIFPANATNSATTGTGSGTPLAPKPSTVNTGAIAGAAVGAIAVVAAIAFGIWFFLRRRKRAAEEAKAAEVAQAIQAAAAAAAIEEQDKKDAIMANSHEVHPQDYKHELDTPGVKSPELYGDQYITQEMSGEERMAELAARQDGIEGRFELEAPHGMVELSNAERQRTAREMLPSQRGDVDIFQSPQTPQRYDSTGEKARPFSWQAQA